MVPFVLKTKTASLTKHTNSRRPRRFFCDRLLTDWTTMCSPISSMKAETRYYSEKLKNVLNWNLSARRAQSVQRLATGWTVRGLNAGEDEIFRTCPDGP